MVSLLRAVFGKETDGMPNHQPFLRIGETQKADSLEFTAQVRLGGLRRLQGTGGLVQMMVTSSRGTMCGLAREGCGFG